MANAVVYMLTIEHKHGINSYLNKTKEGSENEMRQYVHDWWGDYLDKEKPETWEEVSMDDVYEYFENTQGSESFNREEVEIKP